MTLPSLPEIPAWLTEISPYAATGGVVLAMTLAWIVALARRPRPAKPVNAPKPAKDKPSPENRLTALVALIIAGMCAQGMGMFLHDRLHFPIELVIVVGGVLELTAFTCALRARRNIRESETGSAGVDGIAVWVVTALSGAFSAMDADTFDVALFRLAMPLLAAWLWERSMSIERRRVRGGSSIHWRITPERVLVWLRIAEPTGRTASEVDAHRRLTRVAKAAKRVRRLRLTGAWQWRIDLAEARLERAMESAVAHAGLASDPGRQQALLAQIGSLYNAAALANLSPDAPWAEFAAPPTAEPTRLVADSRTHSADPTRSETHSPNRSGTQVPDLTVNGSETSGSDRSANGSETQTDNRSRTQVSDPNTDQVPDRSAEQVPDPSENRSETQVPDPAKQTQPKTGPNKRTRSKVKPLDRIDEARAADSAYLAEHGRHIPAEKLATALRIGKPAALELVKKVRGARMDIAK